VLRFVHRAFPAAAISLLCVTGSSRAGAFERQWHAGGDIGWSAVSFAGGIFSGYGGGAHLTYGLTDTFNAMLELGATSHTVYLNRPNLTVLSGAAGIGYTLDVLRWVPYAALLVGGYSFSGANLVKADPRLGFQVAVGLDYAIARSVAVGVQVRYHTFSDDPFSASYLTTFARVEYLWGW
jgi:opacity protein-like surface antigen